MVNSEQWLELQIPLKGKIILRFDSGEEREAGYFEYKVPVKFLQGKDTVGIPTVTVKMSDEP